MYCVYLPAKDTNAALCTGVTNDLPRRVYEHRNHPDPKSFTARYAIHKLACYEACADVRTAIEREEQIKSRSRKRKNALAERVNPEWRDLYPRRFLINS